MAWAAAGPSRASRRRATHQHTRNHRHGGHRRDLPRCRWAAAGPGRAIHSDPAPMVWRAAAGHGRASRRRAEPHISDQAPLVWRAPEGPEGTGGLRGAAPNEVRTPSLAGGRALRRPEHPWGHKQHHKHTTTKRGRDRFPGRGLVTLTHRRSANQAPPAIRRSCPRDLRPRRVQPRGGQRGRGTGSRTRSRRPRCGRSGSTAGRHRARHTRRA